MRFTNTLTGYAPTMKTLLSWSLSGRARVAYPARARNRGESGAVDARRRGGDTAPYLSRRNLAFLLLACSVSLPATLFAQFTTYSQQVGADTFVSSGEPDSNFGIQAGMEIAGPTLAQPRTQKTLLRFGTAAMQAAFDADYGPGNWVVTGVTLSLFSNYATAGQQPANARFNKIAPGGFEFDLLSNNNWDEMSITWNTLSDILPGPGNNNTMTSLGTFFWDAAGEPSSTWTLGANPNLASQIYNGDQVTIFGQPIANSTVGYLSNTRTLNPGYLNVTAMAVPEPSIYALVASFLLVSSRRFFLRTSSQITSRVMMESIFIASAKSRPMGLPLRRSPCPASARRTTGFMSADF
jgi:hypothetical protein